MPTAVIVDAIRTPLGRRNGKLKDVHPVDLAAHVLQAVVQRNDIDPALVEDVIMGCVMQVGEQGINIARNAALAAGFPESTVGTTVDRQCGSSQQAAHFAAQGVIAGAYDIVIAAASSSQITDGAAAVLIMSEEKAAQLGLTPRARFHTFALAGVDPVMMLTGPIPATTKVLERAKMTLDEMDLVEINEAFAPVVLAWEKEHHPDMAKVNVNGGAIALGHPLGCSGARLMATLLNELERSGGRYGLQTMCEGGGMANATIIERI